MVRVQAGNPSVHERAPLVALSLEGFRSFGPPQELRFGPVTTLIGPNNSGKSNLLAALELLGNLPSRSLGPWVRQAGGASALLHRGPSITRTLRIRATFGGTDRLGYEATLTQADGDTLAFQGERVETPTGSIDLGGQAESGLAHSQEPACQRVSSALKEIRVFRFHDTGPLREGSREEGRALRADGANLAALLGAWKQDRDAAFDQVSALARQLVPGLKGLQPTPGDGTVRLDWVDDRGDRHDVRHLADGSLRLIALVTALSQPYEVLPWFVALDQPEVGLHPSALTELMAVVRAGSHRCHVLLATHSEELVRRSRLDEIVSAKTQGGHTRLTPPTPHDLGHRPVVPAAPPVTDPSVRSLIDRMVEEWHPVAIWLFGSRARGDHHPESDWDLLVVVSDEVADTPAVQPEQVWQLKREARAHADVIVCGERTFREDATVPTTLVSNAVLEGVLLYER